MARRGRPPKVPNAETVVPEEEKVEPEPKTQEEEPTNGQQDTEVTAAPLADRNALIKRRYRVGIVTTQMQRSFEIKSIDPKTMLLTRGTAFLPAFNDFLADPNPESIADENIQGFVTDIVVKAVTSINFVNKPLEGCTEEETPIEVLDLDERVEIFSAVMELCASEEERTEWSFLPRTVEESTDDQQLS
tara:strand:- start:7096 stop:7662 length:567 start_codon:yes stop_codon:yes gene_type:complete